MLLLFSPIPLLCGTLLIFLRCTIYALRRRVRLSQRVGEKENRLSLLSGIKSVHQHGCTLGGALDSSTMTRSDIQDSGGVSTKEEAERIKFNVVQKFQSRSHEPIDLFWNDFQLSSERTMF